MIILDQVFFHPIGCKSEEGHSKVSPVHHPQTLRSLETVYKAEEEEPSSVEPVWGYYSYIYTYACTLLYVMINIPSDSGEFIWEIGKVQLRHVILVPKIQNF